MVARFVSGKSIEGALRYNEDKVKNGKADCIEASGYARPKVVLSFHHKLARLSRLAALNERVKTNCIHVSLNFDPSENLSDAKLCKVAETYIRAIGFADQPYLVYRHFDAAHPHIHIVTTNIQPDGKRIALHNIGRYQSEEARKKIEKIFGLVPAESRKKSNQIYLKPIPAQRAVYGKSETKSAISNTVREVIRSWKFTSLIEFNTILKCYNVLAKNGKEGSRLQQKGGLVYSILDEQGQTIGVPIKASSIYTKPTLAKLQMVYEQNKEKRKPYRYRIKNCIDKSIGEATDRTDLQKALEKEGIQVVFRENNSGRIYGATFLDLKAKVVFNGSDLGKAYSASNLLKRLEPATKVALTEQKMHKDELLKTLQLIDYSRGFASVLAQLYVKGIVVRKSENVDGEIRFFLKDSKKPSAKMISADANFTAYLLASSYSKNIEIQLQEQVVDSAVLIPSLSFLENWIAGLLKSEADYGSYPMNNMSKKKKKRKPNW